MDVKLETAPKAGKEAQVGGSVVGLRKRRIVMLFRGHALSDRTMFRITAAAAGGDRDELLRQLPDLGRRHPPW